MIRISVEQIEQSPGGGVLPEKLGMGLRHSCQNPYPIYDLTKNLIPYL